MYASSRARVPEENLRDFLCDLLRPGDSFAAISAVSSLPPRAAAYGLCPTSQPIVQSPFSHCFLVTFSLSCKQLIQSSRSNRSTESSRAAPSEGVCIRLSNASQILHDDQVCSEERLGPCMKALFLLLSTAAFICAVPASGAVTVTSPVNGATVTSPFT